MSEITFGEPAYSTEAPLDILTSRFSLAFTTAFEPLDALITTVLLIRSLALYSPPLPKSISWLSTCPDISRFDPLERPTPSFLLIVIPLKAALVKAPLI